MNSFDCCVLYTCRSLLSHCAIPKKPTSSDIVGRMHFIHSHVFNKFKYLTHNSVHSMLYLKVHSHYKNYHLRGVSMSEVYMLKRVGERTLPLNWHCVDAVFLKVMNLVMVHVYEFVNLCIITVPNALLIIIIYL